MALRFTGCVASGSPWDVTTSAIKTTTGDGVTPAVSDTTTGADRLWVWIGSFYNGDSSCTPPSGYTERADATNGSTISVATVAQAVAGSSGSVVGTFVGSSDTGA